jgi:hypothetical protein
MELTPLQLQLTLLQKPTLLPWNLKKRPHRALHPKLNLVANDEQYNLLNIPMTSKNDFGSIPLAELKSVPVFLRDLIASRTPCTIATQDTSEKT